MRAVELDARIVDNQDRVAASVFEQTMPGITIWICGVTDQLVRT
jgi:hypothetical protein